MRIKKLVNCSCLLFLSSTICLQSVYAHIVIDIARYGYFFRGDSRGMADHPWGVVDVTQQRIRDLCDIDNTPNLPGPHPPNRPKTACQFQVNDSEILQRPDGFHDDWYFTGNSFRYLQLLRRTVVKKVLKIEYHCDNKHFVAQAHEGEHIQFSCDGTGSGEIIGLTSITPFIKGSVGGALVYASGALGEAVTGGWATVLSLTAGVFMETLFS